MESAGVWNTILSRICEGRRVVHHQVRCPFDLVCYTWCDAASRIVIRIEIVTTIDRKKIICVFCWLNRKGKIYNMAKGN